MLFPEKRFSLINRDLFDDFFNDSFFDTKVNTMMSTDIKETDTGYILDMNIPGFNKEDLKMSLNNGYLTITGETTSENTENDEEGRIIRQERHSGSCTRSFYVGEAINEDDIKASYTNGVLTVQIPKKDHKEIETKKFITIE